MYDYLGFCPQCGANGKVGSQCEYCGSTIFAVSSPDIKSTGIQSWTEFQIDGFEILRNQVEGSSDFQEYCVVRGKQSGKQGLIDRTGKFVIRCIYDYVRLYSDYNICSIGSRGQNGVIGVDGKFLIPLKGCYGALGFYDPKYDRIYGYKDVSDIQGNKISDIPSKKRIFLISSNLVTTMPDKKGIFKVETGCVLLDENFVLEKSINDRYYIVSKFIDGSLKYGVYDTEEEEFTLDIMYSNIMCQDDKTYFARMITNQSNCSIQKTILFTVSKSTIKIIKEETQTFNNINSGMGCMIALFVAMTVPVSLYFIL